MSLYYQHLTYPEIKAAAERDALILIPVGQVEEHGPHLPVETDCIIATAAARAAAEAVQGEIPVLILPTVWTAYSVQQVARWPGLITFREPEPMITMMYDIMASLIRSGFRKIVIVNAHGNNPAILELACRKIGSDFNVFPAVTYVLAMSKGVGPAGAQVGHGRLWRACRRGGDRPGPAPGSGVGAHGTRDGRRHRALPDTLLPRRHLLGHPGPGRRPLLVDLGCHRFENRRLRRSDRRHRGNGQGALR